MKRSFRRNFIEYFYFLKKDRNGVIILIVLIVAAIGGHFILGKIKVKASADITGMIKIFEAWEDEQKLNEKSLKFFSFNPNTVSQQNLDSLAIPNFIKNNIIKYRLAGGHFLEPTDLKKIYGMNDSIYTLIEPWLQFPVENIQETKSNSMSSKIAADGYFNPNTSAAEELLLWGFNSFQISNIVKYRKNGGRFYKAEDLLKIYGVDSLFFNAIRDNIIIEEPLLFSNEETPSGNLQIELNAADSLMLVQLKGIGPVFASRIIKYRQLLGGFYSINQLLEVYGFPEETFFILKEHFNVDTSGIKKMRINFAEYVDLVRHPYLEKEHVNALLNYRNQYGPFLSDEQLLTKGLIDSVSFERVKPYITCR